MFGAGIASVYHLTRKFKRIKILGLGVVCLVVVLVVVVLPFPEWLGGTSNAYLFDSSGQRHDVSVLVKEPDYVSNLVNYLNNSPEKGGVLVLPKGLSMPA